MEKTIIYLILRSIAHDVPKTVPQVPCISGIDFWPKVIGALCSSLPPCSSILLASLLRSMSDFSPAMCHSSILSMICQTFKKSTNQRTCHHRNAKTWGIFIFLCSFLAYTGHIRAYLHGMQPGTSEVPKYRCRAISVYLKSGVSKLFALGAKYRTTSSRPGHTL